MDSNHGDGAHSDFWRASPEGMLYLLRGFEEDGDDRPAKTELGYVIPILRVGEVLLHAEQVASLMENEAATVTIRFGWNGLAGRRLTAFRSPRRHGIDIGPSRRDRVQTQFTFTAERVRTELPELVHEITKPLYAAFDFYEMPLTHVEEELRELRLQRRR